MSIIYGYETSSRDDPLVQVVTKAVELGIAMMTPERAMLLKTFPSCELTFLHEKEIFYARFN
jgi:hypothetical protein